LKYEVINNFQNRDPQVSLRDQVVPAILASISVDAMNGVRQIDTRRQHG
jgi:hypothetical protein